MVAYVATENSTFTISLVGAYLDTKGVSQSILLPILNSLHLHPQHFELKTVCVGEMATYIKDNKHYTLVTGIAVNVMTGDIFTAKFTDKGLDMDLRVARTLCSGDAGHNSPGMMNIYNNHTQELSIGPFSYTPLRAVDIWLQQPSEFLLKMLSPCPEAVEDPYGFVEVIRRSLELVKLHPYPLVSVFQNNKPRTYSKGSNGQWISKDICSQSSPRWQNSQ